MYVKINFQIQQFKLGTTEHTGPGQRNMKLIKTHIIPAVSSPGPLISLFTASLSDQREWVTELNLTSRQAILRNRSLSCMISIAHGFHDKSVQPQKYYDPGVS